MCPHIGRAASGTSRQALLTERASRAACAGLQCARFRREAAAEGSLQPSRQRERESEGKCACLGEQRSARPNAGSMAKRPKPLPCRPLATDSPCGAQPPASCPPGAEALSFRASYLLCRSRAKRGEGFPLLCWVGYSWGRHPTWQALHTHTRSRAKRGEGFSPLLVLLDIWLNHDLVVILQIASV